MGREIKFRGKVAETGEWIYGYYVYDAEMCQHKIYVETPVPEHKLQIVYDNENACFRPVNIGECHQPNVRKNMWDMIRSKVIGNKTDNPELLK